MAKHHFFANHNKKAFVIIIAAGAVFIGAIIVATILTRPDSEDQATDRRLNSATDALQKQQGNKAIYAAQILAQSGDWTLIQNALQGDDGDPGMSIFHTVGGKMQLVMGPSSTFDICDMVKANVPSVIQAAALGQTVDDIATQVSDCQLGLSDISFDDFDELYTQGLSYDQITTIEGSLTNWFQGRHLADPTSPQVQEIQLANLTMDGAGTNIATYHGSLVIDNKTNQTLTISLDEDGNIDTVTLANVDGSNIQTLFSSGATEPDDAY